jgi:drug/metabolite transporter (DMT)-like permease
VDASNNNFMNHNQKSHLALIVAGILFGANYWIAKYALVTFQPFIIVSYRIAVATAVFWLIDAFRRKTYKVSGKEIIVLFAAGLLGVTINQTMFFAGLKYSTPVETSLLHTLSPILVAVLAVVIINESITKMKVLGIMFGFIGCLIIILTGKEISMNNSHFIGNIYILINIIAYSIFLVIVKPLMAKHNSIFVLKYIFLFGLLTYFPFGLVHYKDILNVTADSYAWLSLTYVIFGTTIITYFLTMYAVQKLPATTVGFYIYLQPFIAAGIGYATGKEAITIMTGVAALLLFIGIWFVIREYKT